MKTIYFLLVAAMAVAGALVGRSQTSSLERSCVPLAVQYRPALVSEEKLGCQEFVQSEPPLIKVYNTCMFTEREETEWTHHVLAECALVDYTVVFHKWATNDNGTELSVETKQVPGEPLETCVNVSCSRSGDWWPVSINWSSMTSASPTSMTITRTGSSALESNTLYGMCADFGEVLGVPEFGWTGAEIKAVSASLIREEALSDLYSTEDFVDLMLELFEWATFPDEWTAAPASAIRKLTEDELRFSIGNMQYRIAFTGEAGIEYKIEWIERFTAASGEVTDVKKSETLIGTGKQQYTSVITVEAPDQYGEITVVLPPPPESCTDCVAGTDSVQNGSIQLSISLGRAGLGESAGRLYIDEPWPTNWLATPKSMRYDQPSREIPVFPENGDLRQVKAPEAFADIVTIDAYKYEIRLYHSTNVDNPPGEYFTATGSPYATWTIENPDNSGATSNQLRIVKSADGVLRTNDFVWSDTDPGWTLVSGGGLRKEVRIITSDVANTNETETLIIKNQSDQVVYKESTTFKLYPDPIGRRLIEKKVDPDGAALTSRFTYFDVDTDGLKLGKAKLSIESNEGWKRNEYDTNGRLVKQIIGFLNAATNAAEAACRVLEFDYTPVDASDDGSLDPDLPRRTIEKLLGEEISRHFYVARLGERRDIQCQTAGAFATNASNLVTITKTYTNGNFAGRLKAVKNPDDTRRAYLYATNATYITTVALAGQPDPANETNVLAGTRTVTVSFLLGQDLSTAVYDIESGFLISSMIHTNFDAFRRPLRTSYRDGTSEYRAFSCCGVDSITNRDGSVVSHQYDRLNRVSAEHRFVTASSAIVTTNLYDPLGNVLSSVRIGTNATAIIVSRTGYDLAGRRTQFTNALQHITTFSETIDGSGQTVRTTTFPNLSTKVETYAKDGSLLKIAGTAVHGVRYDHGVEADSGVQRAYTKEIKLHSNGSDTGEWTKTYADMLKRPYKTIFSDNAYSQTAYNNLGQVSKEVDADGVTTLLHYTLEGEIEDTTIDMDRNGSIDLTGIDRITRTLSDVVTNTTHGAAVRRTRTYVWPNSSSTPQLVTTTETSLDGFNTWVTLLHGGIPVVSSVRAAYSNGHRYLTNQGFDGTYTTSDYQYGRLLSQLRKGPDNTQIGATTYEYDEHGRLKSSVDARNGATGFTYDDADRQINVTTPAPPGASSGLTTWFFYNNMGWVTNVLLPSSGFFPLVSTEYQLTGEVATNWGSYTLPVAYTYDYAGRMKTMTTWTNFDTRQGAAVTAWNYDAYRGFLTNKAYAGTNGPSYTYTAAGRLQSRGWARGVTCTYATNAAGDIVAVSYTDGTPGLTYTHDRLGRVRQIDHGTNVTTLVYNEGGQVLAEVFNGITVSNTYNASLLREKLQFLISNSPQLTNSFTYDQGARLTEVSDGTYSAAYQYEANSSLISTQIFKQNSSVRLTVTNWWDNLHRPAHRSSMPAADDKVMYYYAHDTDSARVIVILREDNAGAIWTDCSYDDLGQLVSAKRRWWAAYMKKVAGQQFHYDYDDIGNRRWAASGGDEWANNLRYESYTANDLNQYTKRTVPGWVNVIGSATNTATVTVNDQATYRSNSYFRVELTVNNLTNAVWHSITNIGVLNVGTNYDLSTTNTGYAFVPQTPENYQYDADGNLTSDGRWMLTWDAENRLIRMESFPNAPTASRLTLDFAYDYRGRRISKTVSNWTSGLVSYARFAYDDWNLVAELNGTNNAVLGRYMWGTDLSGTKQGAGGVGGLLAVNVGSNGVHFTALDGKGNIVALVDAADGRVSAQYDYGPFGEAIRVEGTIAKLNPIRFSSKYRDDETGWVYYGYRYYNPRTGRWISRDPAEEQGGLNLHGFVGNNPVSFVDPFGLKKLTKNEGVKALDAGIGSLNAVCEKSCVPEACCTPKQCKQEAKAFIDILVNAWNRNYGKGPHDDNAENSATVGGYLCWDWARIFENAARSIDFKCFEYEIGGAVKVGYKGPPLHYYLEVYGCKRKLAEFQVSFDDGFFDGEHMVHVGPFPDKDSEYKDKNPIYPIPPPISPFVPTPRPETGKPIRPDSPHPVIK